MSIRKVDNNIWIVTHCPKCGQKNSVGVVAFSDAIDRQDAIVCAACKVRFYVVISFLDPHSPTLRAPVHAEQNGAEMFAKEVICPVCGLIVSVYDGNKYALHTPNHRSDESYCKSSNVAILPHSNRSAGG